MRNRKAFMISMLIIVFVAFLPMVDRCWAVSTKIVRHENGADFLKGKTENVVIDLRGTIQLGRASQILVEEFEDVWSINSIVVSGGTVYLGTSPNGDIYKYSLGELTKIYSTQSEQTSQKSPTTQDSPQEANTEKNSKPNDANEFVDANEVKAGQYLSNEHIFAMSTDLSGRLLAGISGEKCRLCRLEANKMETIFEPNDARYIFAIATDNAGNIYLGTGPNGKVYQLDSLGRGAQVIYSSLDKNILSIAAAKDGFIYAGSDGRGLVYRINPRMKTATVLYDSEQPEITALLFALNFSSGNGDLYAAATSAQIVQSEASFAAEMPMSSGRPEVSKEKQEGTIKIDIRKLQIANTRKRPGDELGGRKTPIRPPAKPDKASHIYKISKDGFVTDIFSEALVFFCLAEQDSNLLLGTGNSAQLFAVNPDSEQQAIIYEDEQSSQITTAAVAGDVVYLGTANPAKLIKLNKTFTTEGTYISDLVDAGQPAKWGKLQIEADIPKGCKILVASRSGNVEDVNDPTFSDWTDAVEMTGPVQLSCPVGRFCQYKLLLKSEDGSETPVIREVAVASTVPNLAPKVESVNVSRIESANKVPPGLFKLSYKTKDDNGDKLIYKIDLRKIGRTNWIELEDEREEDSFNWDGKTVEDGRYEFRVTASDERSNTVDTKLTNSRISDPVTVDNTGPVISEYSISKTDTAVMLKLQVHDELSVIGELQYTVDSNEEWKGAVPDDMVCDTMDESYKIAIEDLKPGEHILTIRAKDDVDNTTYKTFEVNMD
jgi:outer membrane protein assembly factor BamB